MLRSFAALLIFGALLHVPLGAQNSVFGVHGLGFPGRAMSASSRALGGGPAAFDPRSAINPATVAGMGNLVVTATAGTSLRNFTVGDSAVDGLSETRFPFAMLGGGIRGTPLAFSLSYSTYSERTYDILTSGTETIRGSTIDVSDRITSEGAIVDIRGALAMRLVRQLSVGGAFHMLGGSSRLRRVRYFSDDNYQALQAVNRANFSGMGFSGGIMFYPISRVTVSAAIRTDTELKTTLDSAAAGAVDLPTSITGGLYLVPHPGIRLSTTLSKHFWSAANDDLRATGGANAFDTWEIGSGLELARAQPGTGVPVRFGIRYSTLPFSPTLDQASEFAYSAGTAFRFAGNRAAFDIAVERATRKGAGANERSTYFMFSLSVMP